VAYLIDTSILARLANTADTFYPIATHAVLELHRRGEVLHVTPQNLVEFRNVATRPVALNGLGLAPSDAEAKAAGFEAAFPLLVETPDIFPLWKALVGSLAVVGKQVHDARLVAACHAHNVTHLLTFNTSHFARLASFGTGITVVDPATV
jgi:predicted nucleic acid-binding protein